jgi:phosphopantetheine adenylyltransferase
VHCALSKFKQKVLLKLATGIGGSNFCCLVVDEVFKKWSFFLKGKSDQVENIITFLKDMKVQSSKLIKFTWCDNAGENRVLAAACKKEGL